MVEDIGFYVDEAVASGGPGGRARRRHGPDRDPGRAGGRPRDRRRPVAGMLAVARATRRGAGRRELVDLRVGDLREPPVEERVPLVICPFRSLLHMPDEAEKLRRLRAAPRAARAGRPPRLRRLRSERGGHRGDRRALARARARHLRARRLGRGRAHADALGARRRVERDDGAALALARSSGDGCSTRRASRSRRSTAGSTAGRSRAARTVIWVCRRSG